MTPRRSQTNSSWISSILLMLKERYSLRRNGRQSLDIRKATSRRASQRDALLRQQETPGGTKLGLFALDVLTRGDTPLYVIGGQQIDKDFLATLELPAGMRVLFYQNLGGQFSSQLLIDPSGRLQEPGKLASLIEQARTQRRETSGIVHWSSDAAEDEAVHAIPLSGDDDHVLGILLAGASRRPYVELRQHIRSAALLAAG